MTDTAKKTNRYLLSLPNANPSLKGFSLTVRAVEVYIERSCQIKTMALYEILGVEAGISPKTVERNIIRFKESVGVSEYNNKFIATLALEALLYR